MKIDRFRKLMLMAVVTAVPAMAWAQAGGKDAGTRAAGDRAKPDQNQSMKLLWIRSKYNGPIKDRLVESEKLTVAEYRKRGVEVIEPTKDELEKWREGEGRDYAKAHKYMQHLAHARKLGVDALGGLSVFEVTPELTEAFEDRKPGEYLHAWGINLKSCDSNFAVNLAGGDAAQAIPLALTEGDAWDIPKRIVARSCESSDAAAELEMMGKGRPFLGVQLDSNKVISVIPHSPAEAVGVVIGDTLKRVAQTEIQSLIDLASAVGDRKPGDVVEISFEHEGKELTKSVTLADRAEVQMKSMPDGKPLPSLSSKDIHGKEVKLADLKGKVILLDFWATWCGPCIEEMPLIQLTWDNLKDKGLVWIGISGDEDDDAWREFVKNNNLGGTQIRDEKWLTALGVGGFPTIFLVDKSGLVRCRVRGGSIASAAAAMLQD